MEEVKPKWWEIAIPMLQAVAPIAGMAFGMPNLGGLNIGGNVAPPPPPPPVQSAFSSEKILPIAIIIGLFLLIKKAL